MKINPTKQKVVDAASSLFYQKGFHGTSVRDIAEKANVNVSLISYYFKSKQGLLEYAVTNYYETYLDVLEEELEKNKALCTIDRCQKIIEAIIRYKIGYYQLTSFIYRELSLDSIFVREMTVTYLAKENHLISDTFYSVLSTENEKRKTYLFMQLKGMIMAPFIIKHEWNNYIMDKHANEYMIRQYSGTINDWLHFISKG